MKRNMVVSVRRSSVTLVLALSLVLSQFAGVEFASAITGPYRIWDGGGAADNFNDPLNWDTDTLPVTGDVLKFNTDAVGTNNTQTLTNDLDSGILLGGITTDSTGLTNYTTYKITGVTNFADNATLEMPSGSKISVYLQDGLSGAGNLNVIGYWGYMGNSTTINGSLDADGASGYIGGTSGIQGITSLTLRGYTYVSLAGDVDFPIATAAGATAQLSAYPNYDGNEPVATSYTISSPLTLDSDLKVMVGNKTTVNFTGNITGTGNVVRNPYSSSTGVLKVGGETLVNETKTTKLTGDTTDYVQVVDKETAILSGERSEISVYEGGVLKGNGTITGSLWVSGTVSPGNSPGEIIVQDNLSLTPGATYTAEILNKDAYDQLRVTNTVDLGGATLDLKFIAGGKVNKGEQYAIITNAGSDPVVGTFAGLPQGSKITIGGAIFALDYSGGSNNNDVVLTALSTANAPGTPNTGLGRIVLGNPVLVAMAGAVAVLALFALKRRQTNR